MGNKKKTSIILLILCIYCTSIYAQKGGKNQSMKELIATNFNFAQKQYQYLIKSTPADSMPRTFINNKNISSDIYWWCSGFYPGTLWYIYEYTKNPSIRKEAENRLKTLAPVQYYTQNHDLGFMMFCSYGNAYRLTKNIEYKQILLQSAESLSSRYRPAAKVIQSWDVNSALMKKGFTGPVIIDNMMNLEMLEWATYNGASKKYSQLAENHANTTIENHFREDYSSFHVLDYNLNTGEVNKKVTAQGAADSSAWSRGQSWALYGYTMMYRFTKNPEYLKQARGIAKFILTNPNLPDDKVPYWDFDAPNIPKALRDVSSAAINASALLELGQYTTGKEKQEYLNVSQTILKSLSSSKYRAKLGNNGGFLLMHSVGSIPNNSEIDVPLSYADYYFLEALLRYKKWYLTN